MDPGTLEQVGLVAAIVGGTLTVVLWRAAEAVRRKLFAMWSDRDGARHVRRLQIGSAALAFAGMGLWTWAGLQPRAAGPVHRTLNARLEPCDGSAGAPESAEVSVPYDDDLSDTTVQQLVALVVGRLEKDGALASAESVAVTLSVPADLSAENPVVTTRPETAWTAHVVAGDARTQVGDSKDGWKPKGTWAPAAESWEISITPRGYGAAGVELTGAQRKARSFQLPCPRVPVGISVRDAADSLDPAADRVGLALIPEPRVSVVPREVAEAIAQGRADAVRSGVTWIVTCTVR